jgi:hypothetical protein
VSAPTLPVGHEEYAALAVGWALGALEPADQDRFEEHRASCRECEEEVAAALRVAVELAYGVPHLEPPARLRGRLLTAAVEEPPTRRRRPAVRPPGPGSPDADPHRRGGATRGGPGPRWHPRWDRWHRRLGMLAAAALVAVSAVTTWQATRPQQDRPAPVAAEQVAMLSAPAGGGTVATVVVGRGHADVVTDALPPNAGRGTSYLLWGVPAGDAAAPRVVGSFQVTAPGLHSYPVRLVRPADRYQVLAISEERAGSTPTEPGAIIARGALGR